MTRAINNAGALTPRACTVRACRIVINKLFYIAIFEYIRKENSDVRLAVWNTARVLEKMRGYHDGIASYYYGEDR